MTRSSLHLLHRFLPVFFVVLAASGCASHEEGAELSDKEVSSLQAFAELYGLVRYFHPSDAAAGADWERLALHGASQVRGASTTDELEETLGALFHPIAPTLQLYQGESPPKPAAILTPQDTSDLRLVAWQHRGVGLSTSPLYRSDRLNRPAPQREKTMASTGQSIDSAPYQGRKIRLTAAVKTDVQGPGNQAQLFLMVLRPGGKRGFRENMADRPITDSTWQTYEITGTVAEDAEQIGIGAMLQGTGTAWFDDFQLHVKGDDGSWRPVPIENAGFEAPPRGGAPAGWSNRPLEDHMIRTDPTSFKGQAALRIESFAMARPLFEARPEPGEVVRRELGRGLSAQLPLALYSRDGKTLRPGGAPSLEALTATLQRVAVQGETAESEALRLADVVIAWNVLRHFYPYDDVAGIDWDDVLTGALQRASADRTDADFLQTLRWMVVQLKDGHGRVQHDVMGQMAPLPVQVAEFDGEVVVTSVAGDGASSCLERGDVITSVDEVASGEHLQEAKRYISGSPQWKTVRALRLFGLGRHGTTAEVAARRGEKQIRCEVARKNARQAPTYQHAPIEEIKNSIYYVDLRRADYSAINEEAEQLAEAEGIVFDVRGYPRTRPEVLRHLTGDTLRSMHWKVPRRIHPAPHEVAGYDTTGRWALPPKKPRFGGEFVFLTDARAISYAESILGIVSHYELGEIVGEPTAGANGNVNVLQLPGGYQVRWTGMRVERYDGTPFFLEGVQPTIPSERSVEGIRSGRDEQIQKALEVISASDP